MDIYIVQPGDSVDSIAAMYGISPYTIIFDNQMGRMRLQSVRLC